MTRRPAGWAIAAAVLLAACGGGDDDTADPTTAALTTTVPATPSTSAPTTPAPTTLPPTTSAPVTPAPSIPPPTTSAPTSAVLDPVADIAAALQRDAQAGEDTLFAVLSSPAAADAEDRLRQYYAGAALDATLATLADFRANNYVVAPNPDVPVTLLITGPATLEPGSDPPRAVAQTCRLDSAWVMALADNGVRVPFNTTVYRTDAISNFVLVNGIWQLEDGDLINETEGATSCD